MMNLKKWVRAWLDQRLQPRPAAEQDVGYWQDRVLVVALLAAVILGSLSLIPGVVRAAAEGNVPLLVADLVAFSLACALLVHRGIPYAVRAGALVALTLVVGVAQVQTSGMQAAGPLWLLVGPIFAAVLFGLRPAFALLAGIATLLAAYLWLPGHLGVAPELAARIGTPRWLETGADLLLLASVISLFIGVLLQGLRSTFEELRRTGRDLEEERARLVGVNRELEQEVERRRRAEAERVELETQLRQSQKMQAIGTFAGGIAHDFNNLLVPILGSAEMLAGAVEGGAREEVDDIVRSARRARDLIARILAFSRGGQAERGAIRLDRVLDETDRLLRASLPARIELAYEIDDPGPVLWTESEAQQVILNLATNAFHAMRDDDGGRLLVRVDVVAGRDVDPGQGITTDRPDPGTRYARLSVRDSGCGMDADTLARIFEPFFTTRPAGEGTGLGLSMVHGLVGGAGGLLVATSRPGQGTEIQLLLPRLEADDCAERVDAAPPDGGRGQTVLVVDDEEPVLRITGKLLSRAGFQPLLAHGPDEAMRHLRQRRPDFLITDMSMPGMHGVDLGRSARELHPGLPMILCTGLVDAETHARADDAGFTAVLPKPFGRDELARAVAEAVAA